MMNISIFTMIKKVFVYRQLRRGLHRETTTSKHKKIKNILDYKFHEFTVFKTRRPSSRASSRSSSRHSVYNESAENQNQNEFSQEQFERPSSAISDRSRCSSKQSNFGDEVDYDKKNEFLDISRPSSACSQRSNSGRAKSKSQNGERPTSSNKAESKKVNATQQRPESKKKIERSKSVNEAYAKKNSDYIRWLYSSSWRIHSELLSQVDPHGAPNFAAPTDNTHILFYKTKKKRPETFIFDPEWI
jgi:hypothetical protein